MVAKKYRYVYIAAPYSQGNQNANTRNAIVMAETLISYGYAPYVPHLTHFWDMVYAKPYEYWIKFDLMWVEKCDVLIRTGSFSIGADNEVQHAKNFGIPVVYNLQELLELELW